MKVAKHRWGIQHHRIDAKGCPKRKVNKVELRERPWLRGNCLICRNYQPQKHVHHDSPIAYSYTHGQCVNRKVANE